MTEKKNVVIYKSLYFWLNIKCNSINVVLVSTGQKSINVVLVSTGQKSINVVLVSTGQTSINRCCFCVSRFCIISLYFLLPLLFLHFLKTRLKKFFIICYLNYNKIPGNSFKLMSFINHRPLSQVCVKIDWVLSDTDVQAMMTTYENEKSFFLLISRCIQIVLTLLIVSL